jgi:hypothetical protein
LTDFSSLQRIGREEAAQIGAVSLKTAENLLKIMVLESLKAKM